MLAAEEVDSLVAAGDVLFPLSDHLGTTRDLAEYDSGTDSTTIASHRTFDSFGNITSETNSAVDLLFGYTGRPFDDSTGLQNNLNRWLDSQTGNWISEDPIGFIAGDRNLQRYVSNAPLVLTDPEGLQEKSAQEDIGDPNDWIDRIQTPIKDILDGKFDECNQLRPVVNPGLDLFRSMIAGIQGAPLSDDLLESPQSRVALTRKAYHAAIRELEQEKGLIDRVSPVEPTPPIPPPLPRPGDDISRLESEIKKGAKAILAPYVNQYVRTLRESTRPPLASCPPEEIQSGLRRFVPQLEDFQISSDGKAIELKWKPPEIRW